MGDGVFFPKIPSEDTVYVLKTSSGWTGLPALLLKVIWDRTCLRVIKGRILFHCMGGM